MTDRLRRIDQLCEGAERAREVGDARAFVDLITAAAVLVQLEKNLQRAAGLSKPDRRDR